MSTAGLEVEDSKDFGVPGSGHPVEFARLVESIGMFYEPKTKNLLIPSTEGGWVEVTETTAERFLKSKGLNGKNKDEHGLSNIERAVLFVVDRMKVKYFGPLAGRNAGPFMFQGKRYLVSDSPVLIVPKACDFSIIKAYLERMLEEQLVFLSAWLKVAVESLRSGTLRPGQALVFAGPANCGKSVLQNQIITPLLGGRSAKPYQYMAGKTTFNSDLFGAEHLMIEDESPHIDIRSRRSFGTHIKGITATDEMYHHEKNKVALQMPVFGRLTISCNDEPENLLVLPPMDESIRAKISLFKARPGPMPMPTETCEERTAFQKAICAALPGYLYSLLSSEIPKEIRNNRYGVKEYHHPEILKALSELSPQRRLLDIIDGGLFYDMEEFNVKTGLQSTWEGTAAKLESELTRDGCPMKHEARKLLTFPNALGIYLKRLADEYPERVKRHRTSRDRKWIITRLLNAALPGE